MLHSRTLVLKIRQYTEYSLVILRWVFLVGRHPFQPQTTLAQHLFCPLRLPDVSLLGRPLSSELHRQRPLFRARLLQLLSLAL